MDTRKLTRNTSDKWLGGVCSGLGDYMSLDPTVVRLIFILLGLLGGHGVLLYIILWIVMPPRDKVVPVSSI